MTLDVSPQLIIRSSINALRFPIPCFALPILPSSPSPASFISPFLFCHWVSYTRFRYITFSSIYRVMGWPLRLADALTNFRRFLSNYILSRAQAYLSSLFLCPALFPGHGLTILQSDRKLTLGRGGRRGKEGGHASSRAKRTKSRKLMRSLTSFVRLVQPCKFALLLLFLLLFARLQNNLSSASPPAITKLPFRVASFEQTIARDFD